MLLRCTEVEGSGRRRDRSRKKYSKCLFLRSQGLTTCADCDLLAMLLLRVLSTSLRGMLPFFSALLRRQLPSSRGACRCLCGDALFHHGADPLTRRKGAMVLFVYCSSCNAWMTALCFNLLKAWRKSWRTLSWEMPNASPISCRLLSFSPSNPKRSRSI